NAEARLLIRRHPLQLALLIPGRNDREDGLVESAGEKLHLPARDERAQRVEQRPVVGLQPFEERSRPVHGEAHAGMAREQFQEGSIGALDGVLEDRVEIPDRLVIVDRDRDPDGSVAGGAHGALFSKGSSGCAGFVGRSCATSRTPRLARRNRESRSPASRYTYGSTASLPGAWWSPPTFTSSSGKPP